MRANIHARARTGVCVRARARFLLMMVCAYSFSAYQGVRILLHRHAVGESDNKRVCVYPFMQTGARVCMYTRACHFMIERSRYDREGIPVR